MKVYHKSMQKLFFALSWKPQFQQNDTWESSFDALLQLRYVLNSQPTMID